MRTFELFCLIISVCIFCTSGSVVDLAFKKDAYVSSSYKPASHGVDGDRSTFALSLFPYWFVVDLGSAYNVEHVIVETRTDCCGDRMNKFKVGLLKTFDRNNFTKNILCGEYPKNTTKNKSYRLNCSHSRQRYRYVLLYVEGQDVPDPAPGIVKDMIFAELKAYGDDRGNFLFQYFGCFKGGAGASGSDVSSIDECITVCQRSTYAGLKEGGQCVCLENLPALLPTSLCPSKCFGDEDYCGGNGALSVYKVQECRDKDQLMPCIHHCKEFKQTPRVGCLKGRCEAGWAGEQCLFRDCSRRPCGEHACVTFSMAGDRLSECVCKPGFERRGHFANDCTDADECAVEGACGKEASNCTNTVGSFKCECRSGFSFNSMNKCEDPSTNTVAIVVASLVILFILAALIVCCVWRRCKKTSVEATREEPAKTLAGRFGTNKNMKNLNFNKKEAAITNESSSGRRTDVVHSSASLAGVSSADTPPRAAIEVYEEITGEEDSACIRLQDVKDYLASNSTAILSHFNSVPLESKDGMKEEKKKSNRKKKDKSIVPFDHNRVKLGAPSNDYINASHIKSYKPAEYQFIACQGIKNEEEIEDFWKMVLQNDVCVIVMLTSLTDDDEERCLQYWSDCNMKVYGGVQVSVQNVRKWRHYELRKFVVVDRETAVTMEVAHLCYLSWPHHAVPSNVASLLNVRHMGRQLVRERVHATAKPASVLVQCSTGAGRTGTIIALDTLIEEGKETAHVNPLKCLRDLRKQRNYMIQNSAQYLFCYKAIATHVLLGDTTTFKSNDNRLNRYLSQDAQSLHESLRQQVELIKEGCQEDFKARGRTKKGFPSSEIYPGFSKTQAFTLLRLETTTPGTTSLREDILKSSFVLTIDEATMASLCGLFGNQDGSNIDANDCVVVRNASSGRLLRLRSEKTHKAADSNHVYANSLLGAKELEMRSLELGSDVTECYKACSSKLRDVNEMPILLLYTGEYRQECLWSVMKMHLLQMAEDCGEVDVFQTVYHVYNSILFQSSPYSNYYNAPSPSSPSLPQPLKLDTDTYRNMHDFALKVCNASHLYERLATNIEDKHVYAKAENKKNVYYNEA